jgi:hypothetical protein
MIKFIGLSGLWHTFSPALSGVLPEDSGEVRDGSVVNRLGCARLAPIVRIALSKASQPVWISNLSTFATFGEERGSLLGSAKCSSE